MLLALSAVILVLSLLASARLTEIDDRTETLSDEIILLERRNSILQAQYESLISMEELECYAVEVLGMQRLSPWQIFYLDVDDVVIG